MEDTKEKSVKLGKNISHYILDENSIDNFFKNNPGIHEEGFREICYRYGFPDRKITVVVQNYYIDAAYRDVYYNYWAKFHFNWPRYCKRVSLFRDKHIKQEFWNDENNEELQEDYLGTIIVRPSYVHNETTHTFGRTLLNPYKMVEKDSETGKETCPFPYIITTRYKMHLLGNEFITSAFPFSSQDGIAMKCAETAIYCLCDFESTISSLYARKLPSDIQNTLNHRISERILPSHGMYCNDISYLLKEFGYSPMIYAGTEDYQKTQKIQETKDIAENTEQQALCWDEVHKTDFKNWFHYYIESAIPILTITSFRADEKKHAVLAIGHGRKRKQIKDCNVFRLGDYPCIDSSQLYDGYIINDDNQIPYVEEQMDHFTLHKNYKLEAFIVPLEKHVFLEAAAAVSICDAFIENQKERLKKAIDVLKDICYSMLGKAEEDAKSEWQELLRKLDVSVENPLVVRYYLANSAGYKQFRIKHCTNINEKEFYADVLMPKAVWIAEISTFQYYEMGYSIGEVVLDATASSRSKVDSVILLRISGNGVYRLPDETYDDLENKIKKEDDNILLSGLFEMYTNFNLNKRGE